MSGVDSPEPVEPRVSRGRIDKRQAILRAAFSVFSKQGFAQACVKEIAAEAGVAKPTVYNHLDSKDNLFRHSMEAAAEEIMAENLAAVELLTPAPADLGAAMEDVGRRILRCHHQERAWALRRLLYAEGRRFPELLDTAGSCDRRLLSALADRLARLSLAGRLRVSDPDEAAGQFLALLTGPLEMHTRYGTRESRPEEVHAIARAAADTFLRAFSVVEPEGRAHSVPAPTGTG